MRAELEAKAAELAVRFPDAGDAERAEILAWAGQEPAHAVAFACAESALKDAERLKALGLDLPPEEDLPADVVPVETAPGSSGITRRGMILTGTAALVVAAAATVPAMRLLTPGTHSFSTERGEVREVRLVDGSTLHINTASKVEVAFTGERRLVRLIEGEAAFDVAHDTARRFDVEAGDTVTRAVGTRFTVRRLQDDVEVTVTEGVVAVRGAGSPETRLSAGHGALIARGMITASALDDRDIARRTAWQDRMLELDGLTIAEAVAEFNRYRAAPIVIGDPAIASLRVGGRFGLMESDKFLTALRSGFGVTVSARPDGSVEIAAAS